ncbi:MAG: CBS domain-containing protein [Conexivisphaerales archaeon]
MVLYAKDIVDKDFITMTADSTALQAAKVMKEKRHGFVVIVGEDQKPLGIVTEWDYVAKVVADEKDPSKTMLAEIMTPNVITVNANDGIDKVAEVMSQKMIRRVLVLDNGRVLGVITSRTIIGSIKEYVDRVSAQIARLQAPPF